MQPRTYQRQTVNNIHTQTIHITADETNDALYVRCGAVIARSHTIRGRAVLPEQRYLVCKRCLRHARHTNHQDAIDRLLATGEGELTE